jgi:hypothetical protein
MANFHRVEINLGSHFHNILLALVICDRDTVEMHLIGG